MQKGNLKSILGKSPFTMNDLFPRPWDSVAYAITVLVSLGMVIEVIIFVSSHCEHVLEQTGSPGACGIGAGWVLFCLAFLGIAAYSAWQLYGLWKERGSPT